MVSNMEEVRARGAYVVAITQEGNTGVEKVAERVIYIPKNRWPPITYSGCYTNADTALMVSSKKGLDVDKPRNLAKSVTVE